MHKTCPFESNMAFYNQANTILFSGWILVSHMTPRVDVVPVAVILVVLEVGSVPWPLTPRIDRGIWAFLRFDM